MTPESNERIILDQPDTAPIKVNTYNGLGYAALGVFAIGIVMQMFHISGWIWLVIAGMGAMGLRSTMIFVQKKHAAFAWFYFIGRILLFVAAGIYFSGLTKEPKLFFVPLACFLIGLILVFFTKNQESEDDI
jgi:hypothetical protein